MIWVQKNKILFFTQSVFRSASFQTVKHILFVQPRISDVTIEPGEEKLSREASETHRGGSSVLGRTTQRDDGLLTKR